MDCQYGLAWSMYLCYLCLYLCRYNAVHIAKAMFGHVIMYIHMHVMSHEQTLSGDPNMNPAKDKTLEQGFCIAPEKVTKSDENEILTLSIFVSLQCSWRSCPAVSHISYLTTSTKASKTPSSKRNLIRRSPSRSAQKGFHEVI